MLNNYKHMYSTTQCAGDTAGSRLPAEREVERTNSTPTNTSVISLQITAMIQR